jgi:GT2 family glycosyltransferase
MTDRLRATIVVPHYNDPMGLDRCLAALEAQTVARDAIEIIVADNMSPVGIAAVRAVVRDRARLVEVAEQGAGPARNGGAAIATGPVLAFTDSDCLPEPGWLAAGLAALDGADIIGGQMMVLVEHDGPMTPAEAFEVEFAFANEDYVRRKYFTVTANLFVRRGDFERVGGFRTGVSEDQEWCLRARAMGLRIAYAADAVVGHPARRDWGDLLKKWRRVVAEQYAITREQRFGRARWLAKTLLLPASIVAHLPRIIMSSKLSGLGNRYAAAKALVRLRIWRFISSLNGSFDDL